MPGVRTSDVCSPGNASETLGNSQEDMQINVAGVTTMSASDFRLH